jgi:hypothetical protein
MASAAGDGGSNNPSNNNNNNNNNNDPSALYRAVDAGASAEQVRHMLAEAPSDAWREAALAYRSSANNETALQAAHRLRLGPVVGVLLEYEADVKALHPDAHPLVVCIAYGQVDTLRVLLRSGRHTAEEKVTRPFDLVTGSYYSAADFTRPAHLCVWAPRIGGEQIPPQLKCLEVLVREF